MFQAMFSPIIGSTWLYLQYLVVFTQVAAGWCLGWVETALAATWVNSTRYCKYSQVLLMMGESIARNMWSWLGIINESIQFILLVIFAVVSRCTVVFTQVAAGWCLGWVETAVLTHPRHQPAATSVNTTDTVNTVKCFWWWSKTSPETCRADLE
jgi:hypothetical protein